MKELYRTPFDIDDNGMYCAGNIIVYDELLSVKIEEKELKSYTFKDIKEFLITSNIGCSTLEIKFINDDSARLCRFTQSCLKVVSEFVTVTNYYINTGNYEPLHTEHVVCKKCGRTLVDNLDFCIKCSKKGSIFKSFYSISKKFLPILFLCGLITLGSKIFLLIVPYINRLLVDGYLINPQDKNFGDTNPVTMVLLLCGAMLVSYIMMRVFDIIASLIRNRLSANFTNELRIKLYTKIQLLSMSSVSRRTTGELIKRVSGDTNEVIGFINQTAVYMIESLALFVGVSIYLFITRPIIAIFVFLPVPLTFFVISRFWNFIHRCYEQQWISSSRSNSILHDIVKGIRVVKSFGTEEQEINKFKKARLKVAEIATRNERIWSILFPIISFVITSSEFFILYFGSQAVLGSSIFGNAMTVGELMQIMTYISYIYSQLSWMTFLPRSIASAATSMAKINDILEEKVEIESGENAQTPIIEGNISFKNATFGYKTYEPILKNLSLDIKKGEMVGIVGRSGVGKSTLINLIMRLYDINTGKLEIDGISIKDISKKTLNDSIGVVFQETFLFAGSIYDNLLYANPEATIEDIIAAAKIANAHEFIIRLPDSYNTFIGENGYSLSGGERQRIAIARAVLRDPAILILDEATASLDTETESKIQEALQRLIKGRTTIAIAHRLSTLRNADRLIVMDKGVIAEQGTHTELLQKKGIYYNLVMAQKQTTKMAGFSENVLEASAAS